MLLALSLAASAAWIYLAGWRADFWRADQRLPDAPPPAAWPDVACVIPARDEADGIDAVIRTHMAIDYPGRYSVLLVDDASTDGTADIAWGAGRKDRLAILTAPPLPRGWTGKVAAQRAGLEKLTEIHPQAEYILFADADIAFAPGALKRLVAYAEANDLALVSLMARLDARGPFAQLLAPAFVYFFQMVYPFPAANDPAQKIAAAAGGCMLARRRALAAAGGVDAIKGALIDDCALAAALKFNGPGAPRKTYIGLADDEVVSLRDNRSLSSLWRMVSRSAFAQLNYSWVILIGAVFGLALTFLVPPILALTTPFHREPYAAAAAAAAWWAMSHTYRPTSALYRQPSAMSLLLPVAAVFYLAMTISSALDYARGRGGAWKGRVYPATR